MARAAKTGLDFFPIECDIDSDEKIALIESACGIKGFGILVRLLQMLYRNGYFLEWGEMQRILLARRCNCEAEECEAIVMAALKWRFFHPDLYERFGVLTSTGIQRRYLFAAAKRDLIVMDARYLLLDVSELAPSARKKLKILSAEERGDEEVFPARESTINEGFRHGNGTSEGISGESIPKEKERKGNRKSKGGFLPGNTPETPEPRKESASSSGTNAPHFQWANEWYRQYTERTARAIEPGSENYAAAANVMSEKAIELEVALETVKLYFDPDRDWWFVLNKKSGQRTYSFRGYLRQIEDLISALPNGRAKKRDPPPLCPACGAEKLVASAAACHGCGLEVEKWGDSEAIEEAKREYAERRSDAARLRDGGSRTGLPAESRPGVG